MSLAEKIRREVESLLSARLNVTVSMGVAEWREGEESSDDLFRNADGALYRAKESGRTQIACTVAAAGV